YVPADRAAMLEKAAGRGSDLVIIDLEDAVPLSSKADARTAAVAAAAQLAD
ncbi:MAG: CoA ester lyase, partial [Actinobacteria bacterium]|nr:CoA ester lyase [Actinomycetota bacterium]NIU69898.1 CoA ester lyase [Actinomycetota bacterium]NIW31776.1 CoA ester lyase [Actinomycetota bacterium]